MDTIIRGGTIVTESDTFVADLGIEKGKIAAIGNNLPAKKGTTVINARGQYVMPAGIDVHVHLQLPFCGSVSRDDFENGTKAAACGGLTTVIDFAIQTKGKTLKETVAARQQEADSNVAVDYALHAGITDWNPRTKREMREIIAGGIPSFKMFMIYKNQGWMADDAILYFALEEAAKYGGRIGVHAENVFLLDALIAEYQARKKLPPGCYAHALTRANFTEGEAVNRAVYLAGAAKGSLYVFHLTCKEALQAVAEGMHKGIDVVAETCPQYLSLTEDLFKRKDGHHFATCPPIRSKADVAALWEGVREHALPIVSTDTCTFDSKQKAMWKGDFTKIPFGMPGVETLFPFLFTEGYLAGRLSLNEVVSLVSTNPARLFGLYPGKGSLLPGTDADIVVVDPKRKVKIDWRKLQTNCDFNPFQGKVLGGFPTATLCRGEVVARNGKFTGRKGYGRFVKRRPHGNL